MIVIIRESNANTLAGVLNGTNTVFTTTYSIDPVLVSVYLNGRLKAPDLADGYTVVDTHRVRLKQAPLAGDTLEVEYQLAGSVGGGGAPGGVPLPPTAVPVVPGGVAALQNEPIVASTEQDLPQMTADGVLTPNLSLLFLRPTVRVGPSR